MIPLCNRTHYSILIFSVIPCMSFIPCIPTLLGPREGVIEPETLPLLLFLSAVDCKLVPFVLSRLALDAGWPHKSPLWLGLCDKMGLFCTLTPGLTARRLML